MYLDLGGQLVSLVPWLIFHHLNYPFVQSGVTFPLVAMSRQVGYGVLDFKLLNNISSCGHRNIKLLGLGLVVLTLAIHGSYSLPYLLRQLSFLSLACVECGAPIILPRPF